MKMGMLWTIRRLKLAVLGLLFAAQSVAASDMLPVELEPMTHVPATLTIVDADGVRHDYSQADLEEFATYQLRTTTPWRPDAAVFEGVLLTDILAAHGLDGVGAIEVIAENDYKSEIERAAWMTGGFLIATRVDGMPHSRRARGPIQFVIADTVTRQSELVAERHMVWMARTIQPAR